MTGSRSLSPRGAKAGSFQLFGKTAGTNTVHVSFSDLEFSLFAVTCDRGRGRALCWVRRCGFLAHDHLLKRVTATLLIGEQDEQDPGELG